MIAKLTKHLKVSDLKIKRIKNYDIIETIDHKNQRYKKNNH